MRGRMNEVWEDVGGNMNNASRTKTEVCRER